MKLPVIVLLLFALCAAASAQKTMTIKVYFHNENLNPNMQDCTRAFPTTRTIPKTTAPARAHSRSFLKERRKRKGTRGSGRSIRRTQRGS